MIFFGGAFSIRKAPPSKRFEICNFLHAYPKDTRSSNVFFSFFLKRPFWSHIRLLHPSFCLQGRERIVRGLLRLRLKKWLGLRLRLESTKGIWIVRWLPKGTCICKRIECWLLLSLESKILYRSWLCEARKNIILRFWLCCVEV